MKVTVPSLLPLLRSNVQGDMLALLFLDPDGAYSLTDIARLSGASVRAVHAEANRLVEAGIVQEKRVGNNRMLQAELNSVLAAPLTELLLVTYGPVPLLTRALAGVPGLKKAFIFGSWAARHQGKPGPIPHDVDLLLVGDVDVDALADDIDPIARKLRREIDIHRVRAERWENPGDDPFLQSVRERPLIELKVGAE